MATTTERINVIVDDKGTAKIVSKEVSGIGKSASASQGAVKLLNKALIGIGAGLALGSAVQILKNFSQEMSTVQAITNATETDFQKLRNTAKDLGATTRFSATQAAEGMSFLARAGFDTNQILASIEGTLQLAQAGALDLGRAADIASNILTGFRLEADESGRVVDVLAKAANSANTDVNQLGEAMKFVAPVAAGLGVSLEESAAAIGALSDAGLQASLAGTGLKRVLSELESPSSKSIKIFKELGVEADQVRISQVGLTSALKALADAGVDTADALEIFGDRGGPAFEVLATSIPKVEGLTKAFEEAEGTAARMAAIMDANLNGALLALRSALEAVVIAFGDLGAESFLTDFIKSLAVGVRSLADNLDDAADAMAFLISVMAVQKIVAWVKAVEGATVAQKLWNLAIASNPIGLLLTALTTATAALIYFQDEISITGDDTASLGHLMTATWEAAGEVIWVFGQLYNDVMGFLGMGTKDALGEINVSFQDFLEFGAYIVDSFLGLWTGLYRTMVSLFTDFPEIMSNIFIKTFNYATQIIEDGINASIDLLNNLRSKLGLEDVARVELTGLMDLTEKGFGDIARSAGEAFSSGFDITYAEDAVAGLIGRAKELSFEEMVAGAAGQTSDSFKKVGGDSGGGPDGAADKGKAIQEGLGAFEQYLSDLEKEKELLGLTTAEREIQLEVLALEKDLKRSLTETEKDLVKVSLEEIQFLERKAALFEEIRGPQEEFNMQVKALDDLLKDEIITIEEYDKKLKELDFQKKTDEMGEFADAFQGAFNDAGDALSDFVETGKFDFDSLLISMLEGLKDFALQMAQQELFGEGGSLAGLFGGGGGGGGGAGGAGGIGGGALGAGFAVGSLIGNAIKGYAEGGRPRVNEIIKVGERGTELFVPDTVGAIIPNNEINVQGHSMVNNNQINLTPEIIGALLDNPAGDKAFVQASERNSKALVQTLQPS